MKCPICEENETSIEALCAVCRERLLGDIPISPEQITGANPGLSGAALIDEWGRSHRIGNTVSIGRERGATGFSILHTTISRTHAVISYSPDGWSLRDLGSMNGTWVGDERVQSVATLASRCEVRFGPFRFFFVEDFTPLLPLESQRSTSKTLISFTPERTVDLTPEVTGGLRTTPVVFQQPTGGGGGVVEIDGAVVHLTLAQFELLSILAERMVSDAECPPETRGFMDAAALLKRLSLESSEPGDDSVRQLVRRVRRVLREASLGALIESRPGLGYRLGVIPLLRR